MDGQVDKWTGGHVWLFIFLLYPQTCECRFYTWKTPPLKKTSLEWIIFSGLKLVCECGEIWRPLRMRARCSVPAPGVWRVCTRPSRCTERPQTNYKAIKGKHLCGLADPTSRRRSSCTRNCDNFGICSSQHPGVAAETILPPQRAGWRKVRLLSSACTQVDICLGGSVSNYG